jgi:DNA-binding transcriptional LysR family regulator
MLDINWNSLYGFWLVAQHGSFAAAVRALPRGSAQALHKRVRFLETRQQLDLRLLRSRGARGVELTPAGRRLYDLLDPAFRSLGPMVAELRGEDSGRLLVAMTNHTAYNYGQELLGHYRKEFPKVSLELRIRDSAEVAALVEADQVDLGIGSPPQDSARLTVFASVPMYFEILARDRPAAMRGRQLAWQDIVAEPLIMLERSSIVRQELDAFLYREGLPKPVIVAEATDAGLAVTMVRAGYGMALVPVGPVLSRSLAGLIRIPVPPGLPQVEIGIFGRRERYLSAYMLRFVEIAAIALSRRLRNR